MTITYASLDATLRRAQMNSLRSDDAAAAASVFPAGMNALRDIPTPGPRPGLMSNCGRDISRCPARRSRNYEKYVAARAFKPCCRII